MWLRQKLIQPVERSEIIPIDKEKQKVQAINPLTGLPFRFVFVDNRQPGVGLGTFNNPFSTLLAAQNVSAVGDIVYVFFGNGTTQGMSNGFVFKDNQSLLGSGRAHTIITQVGPITMPAETVGDPTITGPGPIIVTLANNDLISGFTIDATTAVGNTAPITNTTIEFVNAPFTNVGVDITNFSGNVMINACSFTSTTSGAQGIILSNTDGSAGTFKINNTTVSCDFPIELSVSGSSSITSGLISNCLLEVTGINTIGLEMLTSGGNLGLIDAHADEPILLEQTTFQLGTGAIAPRAIVSTINGASTNHALSASNVIVEQGFVGVNLTANQGNTNYSFIGCTIPNAPINIVNGDGIAGHTSQLIATFESNSLFKIVDTNQPFGSQCLFIYSNMMSSDSNSFFLLTNNSPTPNYFIANRNSNPTPNGQQAETIVSGTYPVQVNIPQTTILPCPPPQ
jgi:hypothetical protein